MLNDDLSRWEKTDAFRYLENHYGGRRNDKTMKANQIKLSRISKRQDEVIMYIREQDACYARDNRQTMPYLFFLLYFSISIEKDG